MEIQQRKMLRFATAGSVDDGKSTLIGRLLFDSKSLFDDQMESLRQSSLKKGLNFVDLSLATDGLRAEREQGITIDVAYRYFSTPKRKFIIADTPGHVQYTRNMVTGASTADATIVLIDARKGVQEQSRVHTNIAALLRVPHLILCINKMDLVSFSQEVYETISRDMLSSIGELKFESIQCIPISALEGDNVVDASLRMNWYTGKTVLDALNELEVKIEENSPARFSVQAVIRPRPNDLEDHRHYAGRLTGGSLEVGQSVVVLPSELHSTILRINSGFSEQRIAFPGESVSVELADEIDVSRGDLIVPLDNVPKGVKELQAEICWLSAKPATVGSKFIFRQTSVSLKCIASSFDYRLDVNTGQRLHKELQDVFMNDIVGVRLRLAQPIFADTYEANRSTGSFILIDEFTNETVAAGMIR
jgi:sulfate adenylyltransferase large subunit